MKIPVGRPKDLEKHQRILTAAKNLFLSSGYHGCSMNQIADQAGVTKLTVYNHFQDKAHLFVCAIVITCEELIHAQPLNLYATCDFAQEFSQTCALLLNLINLPEALKQEHLLLELAAEGNPLAEIFYNASHLKLHALWENFFQQAIALGFIKDAKLSTLTLLIMSL